MSIYTRSKRRNPSIDWILLMTYMALVIIGLVMLYTTTFNDYSQRGMWSLSSPFGIQVLWAAISLSFLLIVSFINWQVWNSLSILLYVIGVLSLLLVLIIGTEVKGAKSWLSLGPWSLQPSEFVKLATALFCATLLSSIQTKLKEFRSQLMMIGIMILPALLIVIQPDPGSALTFFSLMIVYFRFGMPVHYYLAALFLFLTVVFSLTQGFYFVSSAIVMVCIFITSRVEKILSLPIFLLTALFLGNVLLFQFDQMFIALIINGIYLLTHLFILDRFRNIYSKLSIIGVALFLGFISLSSSFVFEEVLRPHQQDRINVWLQPEKCDPQGSLYNLLQSKLAIGSGGMTGKGFLNGTLTKLNYVPEQSTDFIFSSIGEEQGFLGSVSVVILFLILSLRILRIGEQSNYGFVRAFCYAIVGFIFFHFFINIGMTMGISPVIGIPLPFISKGGSALLSFSIMIGMIINMSKEK